MISRGIEPQGAAPVRNANDARCVSNTIIQIMQVRLAHLWVEFRVSDLQFENEKNRRIETSEWFLKPTVDDSFIRNM